MGGDTSLNVQNVMISPKEFPRPTHTHIYPHSNEYKLSVTECIELFMCQMFHPSWCQVPGCHTTGHTGCGECDANVLLIRYLIISTTSRTPRSRGVTLTVAPWWWRNIFWENSSTSPEYLQCDSVQQSQHPRRSDNQSQSPVSSNVVI